MIARIGSALGRWLYKNKIIQEKDIDIIRYSLEILFSEFLEVLIIILYSIATKQVYQTVLFLISNMDFYTAKSSHWGGDNNILGETYFYNNSGIEINPTSNWSYTEIYINDDSNRNRYYTEVQGTITHEMGHAFGLKHYNENPYSIMAQTWARKVQVVQQCDNDAINYLY